MQPQPANPKAEGFFSGVRSFLGRSASQPVSKVKSRKLENREKLVTETLQSYTGLEEFPEMAAKLQDLQGSARAAKTQGEASNALKKLDELEKDARKKAMQVARHKPLYTDKCRRIQAAIDELTPDLPATQDNVGKLKDLLDKGHRLVPDYEAAYKAIEGLSKNLEEGRKKAREAKEKAGDSDFREKRRLAREALDAWAAVAGLAEGPEIATQNTAFDGAVKTAMDPSQLVAAKAAMDTVEKTATDKKADWQTKLDDLKTTAKTANELADRAREALPPVEAAPIREVVLRARALEGNQMLGDAKTDYQLVITLATAALGKKADPNGKDTEGYFKEWQGLAAKGGKLETDVDAVLNRVLDPGKGKKGGGIQFAPLLAVASPIQTAVGTARRLAARKQYKDAVDGVNKILPDCGKLKKLADAADSGGKLDSVTFDDATLTVKLHFEKAKVRVWKAAEQPGESIEELDKLQGEVYAYNKELAAVSDAWNNNASAFVDVTKPLNDQLTVIDAAADGAIQTLARLKSTVNQVRADEKLLAASVEARKRGDGERAFDAAKTRAEKQKAALGLLHADNDPELKKSPTPAELQAKFDLLVQQAATGKFAVPEMQRIAEIYENQIALLTNILKARVQAGTVKANALKTKIATLEKENEKYKPFFERETKKVEEALADLSDANIETIDPASKALDAIEAAINKLEKDLRDGGPRSFEVVETELRNVEMRIDSDDLKKYQPAARAALKTRVEKELPDLLHRLRPEDAIKKLSAFKTELKTIEDLAKDAKDLREGALPGKLKTAKEELEAIKEDAPTLYANLEKRIKAVEAAPHGTEKACIVELDSINMVIADAKGPNAAKLEKKASLDKFELDRAEELFKASRDVFEKNAKRQADAVYKATASGELNSDVYKQMETVFEQAKKLADQGRYPEANQSLRRAIALANFFIANPIDRKNGARRELARHRQTWKDAVAEYIRSVQKLQGDIRSATNYPGAAGAADALKPLYQIFDAAVFDKAVDELSKPRKPENLTIDRTRKEAALFWVNQQKQQLNSHLLLKYVSGNTIAPVPTAILRDALRGLEAGFLAA